jgi:hypothetical protein
VAGAAVASGITLLSERAEAFFNMGAFWKRPNTGSGQTSNGYTIGQSLRLSSANSAYLSRTPSSAGNQKTWTWSAWVKRGSFGTHQALFSGGAGADDLTLTVINFGADDTLKIGGHNNFWRITSQLFRDPAAWYHLTVKFDSTQAATDSQIAFYVNGSLVTSFSTKAAISQNTNYGINQAAVHAIGYQSAPAGMTYFDGYLSEVYFIDGQALDASSFGQTDTNSGQWIPKAYSGTYGAQGFYLKFGNSGNLGLDSSPNGNTFTVNNFAATDQMLDSPTNNYCVMNPLDWVYANDNPTSGGNLTVTGQNSGDGWASIKSTFRVSTGKWYFRAKVVAVSATRPFLGLHNESAYAATPAPHCGYTGDPGGWGLNCASPATLHNNNTTGTNSTFTYAANDIIEVAFDMSTGKLWYGKNGAWATGANPDGGTGADFSNLSGTIHISCESYSSAGLTFDFQTAAPSNASTFKNLCTANLPSTMPVVTSGTFTGNANADGSFVWFGGSPTDLTINGNVVIWGTHADKLASGFKIRTSSASYNAGSTNSFSATVPAKFKWATARTNP